jgi:hypothetical protein
VAIWRNRIDIAKYITDNEDDQSVLNICNGIIPQLEELLSREIKALQNHKKNHLDEEFLGELDTVCQEIKWIKEMIENNEDAEEYTFDSWCEAFNNQLEELYNLGDTITVKRGFSNTEKFLWVNTL